MSAVLIDLDTRPPALSIAVADVRHPEVVAIPVVADEEIGHAAFSILDAFGTRHALGFERTGPTSLLVFVPTLGISRGQAVLTGWVDDLVCNRTPVAVAFELLAPVGVGPVYTVDLSTAGPYEVEHSNDAPFEVTLVTSAAFDVEPTTDAPWTVVLTTLPAAFDVELSTDAAEQ